MSKVAICLVTRFLNQKWVDFLKSFTQYDIYIIVDDNSVIHESPIPGTTNIHIIQMEESICRETNYYNSSIWTGLKGVIAWDKALYYFNRINNVHGHVWFIEDDVFFMGEETLLKIDDTYLTADLLCSFSEMNPHGDVKHGWNHWVNVIHRIGTPWARGLICICRLSRRLLGLVDTYVSDRPLMFIESLFHSLAVQNKLSIEHPHEMRNTVQFNGQWSENEIEPTKIYHPMKNIDEHEVLRAKYVDALNAYKSAEIKAVDSRIKTINSLIDSGEFKEAMIEYHNCIRFLGETMRVDLCHYYTMYVNKHVLDNL